MEFETILQTALRNMPKITQETTYHCNLPHLLC